jgi:transposase InsO family protein
LKPVIAEIHERSNKTYGSPRVRLDLRKQGQPASRKHVAKLMQDMGLKGIFKPRRRVTATTVADPTHQPAPNVLDREFHATAPNQRWVTDITYVETGEGWLYVAALMDLFSRKIVGWAMDTTMDTNLVLRALDMAIDQRKPGPDLLHHSDRGCQYTSHAYREHLASHRITVSMSRKGNCHDNACAESFWARLKVECLHRQIWPSTALAKNAVFHYIEGFYNTRRIHTTLGGASPCEFEAAYHQARASAA